MLFAQPFERFRGRAGLAEDDAARRLIEDSLDAFAEHFMVVNDKDSLHGCGLPDRGLGAQQTVV